jgi:hypothetical protein
MAYTTHRIHTFRRYYAVEIKRTEEVVVWVDNN